jgi:ATP-dependent DNA helicase RecG
MFDRDLQKIIEDENSDFIKQALERKQKSEEEEITLTPLEQPITDALFDEFSAEALQKFIIEAKLPYKIEQPEFKNYLATLGVLAKDAAGSYKPTGVGILLFGHNPRLRFKQAALKAHADYGAGKIEPVTFDQPLVLIPDLVQEWLKKVVPLSKDTSDAKLKTVPDFPFEVLREAYINAIVHRNYDIDGAKSSIEIDNDKIVIKSPGAPLPSISVQQLNTFKAPSISRNPIITYVFNLMGYVEETGFGMRAMKSLNEEYGLPLPEYVFEDPFLVLTFPRNINAVKKVTHQPNIEKLTKEELEGYEWIKSKDKITRKEYQDNFKFETKKAERHLKKLTDLHLISRVGSGPSTKYEIIAT